MKNKKRSIRINFIDLIPLLILLAIIILMILINPRLLRLTVLEIKSNAALTLILAATGQTFVLLTGGIDLSLGSIISLTNSLAATQMTEEVDSVIIWSLIICFIGIISGFINGLIVTKMQISPFIATLATQSILQGIAFLILESDGGRVSSTLKDFVRTEIISLPSSLLVILLIVVLWFWLRRTKPIIQIFAVGSYERGAHLSGVRVDATKILAYTLSGFFAALAGLYRTVQVGSGSPIAGANFVLPSVIATVLGGTSLSGGKGGVEKGVIGGLITLFIYDLIFFLDINTFYTPMFQGLLLTVAVAINVLGYRRIQRRGT